MTKQTASDRPRPWIALWFAFDAFFFLFPPIYWTSNAFKPFIFGMPSNLLYFVVGCVCITCSIVVVYLHDAPDQDHRS